MIPIYLFYLLHFIVLFGSITALLFWPIYVHEKKSSFPEFLLGERYDSFIYSLIYYIKESPGLLFIPFIIYAVISSLGFMVDENFTKIITAYDKNERVKCSECVILFTQKLDNGMSVTPFEKERVIVNNSTKRLKLIKASYSKSPNYSSEGQCIVILPQSIFFCRNNYPYYILKVPPRTISVRKSEKDYQIRWGLVTDELIEREKH